jgi:CRISPR-associated endonuclease Csn1
LRIAWGLQWFKKDARGKRVPDDRHHALDAIIVAATTERQLQLLTEAFKRSEEKGEHRDFRAFGQPWLGFRDQAIATVEKIFVSRAEHHRARGKAHDATIKQVRKIDGKDILYERKAVVKLTKDDLENIPVPEPYGKIADPKKLRDELVSSLATWIEAGSPKDSPPLSPKGDPIRKVRLKTTDKVGVEVRGGSADRGEMVRIDVFRKLTKKNIWQHFLVPIYPHEIAGKGPVPNRAVPGELEKEDWPGIGAAEFLFSIRSMSLLEVTKPDGEVILAYFRSLDRSTGAINLSPHENITIVRRSIGARTLLSFKKFTIDRLGRKFEVSREVRTWRGKACT